VFALSQGASVSRGPDALQRDAGRVRGKSHADEEARLARSTRRPLPCRQLPVAFPHCTTPYTRCCTCSVNLANPAGQPRTPTSAGGTTLDCLSFSRRRQIAGQ